MIDLRRLRVLHEVARQRSFSAAALELGYTQSAVSHHIAALEREVGLTLVDRAARPVRLTAAGEILDRHAESIAGEVSAAISQMRAIAGLEAGAVRIAAFMSACATLLPDAVASYGRRHPGVEVKVQQLEPPEARSSLRRGDSDLAVTFDFEDLPDPGDDRVERVHLFDDPYVAILPSSHSLARRQRVRIADLAGERWHLPPVGPGGRYRETVVGLCRAAGFEPEAPYETSDVYVAQGFVSAGLGVALLPRLALLSPRAGMAVAELESAPCRRVWVERRAGHELPAADALIRVLAAR